MTEPLTSRRAVLAAAGMAGLAASIAACGGTDDGSSGYGHEAGGDGGNSGTGGKNGESGTANTSPTAKDGGADKGGEGGDGKDGTSGGAGGVRLGRTSEIPEGGGKVFKDRKVVVTQPKAGEFKAFSATCQHQGCLVNQVAGGTINCPCHGSKYDITDGAVTEGPAPRPLPGVRLSIKNGTIRLT